MPGFGVAGRPAPVGRAVLAWAAGLGVVVSLAAANGRLAAQSRARLAELRLARARLVETADAARRRIERDLHDGAQQRLVAAAVTVRLAGARLAAEPDAAGRLLAAAAGELDAALAELRELARGIHPAVLSERGLDAALRGLAGRAPLPVTLTGGLRGRLPAAVETTAYYVAAEALTNTARHARASHARIVVHYHHPGTIRVEISDDGIGGADPAAGTGLTGLADRLAALDGRLHVTSPLGHGTTIHATIPCPSPSTETVPQPCPTAALAGSHAEHDRGHLTSRSRRANRTNRTEDDARARTVTRRRGK